MVLWLRESDYLGPKNGKLTYVSAIKALNKTTCYKESWEENTYWTMLGSSLYAFLKQLNFFLHWEHTITLYFLKQKILLFASWIGNLFPTIILTAHKDILKRQTLSNASKYKLVHLPNSFLKSCTKGLKIF